MELELPIFDGGEIHAPAWMELSWFTLEELEGHSTIIKEEQLIDFVYLKTLIIFQKQQDFQDQVQYGVLNMKLVEIYIQVFIITTFRVLSATYLPGHLFS